MILLESGSRVLGDAVQGQLAFQFDAAIDMRDQKRNAFDVTLWDFDDVSYRVQVDPTVSTTDMHVSMNLPCYDEIKDFGAKDALEAAFPDMMVEPVSKFNITLKVDMSKYTDAKSQTEMAEKLRNLKAIAVGGVYKHFLGPLSEGKDCKEAFKFNLRTDTQVYFVPKDDRVTIVYGIDFGEKVDKVIARVFMQEFQDARRRLGAAPPCTWGVDPPRELAVFDITEPTGNLGFLALTVLPAHLERGRIDNVVSILVSFRNYVQYHIKCSKTFFHARMRQQVTELMKVLNRAKVEDATKVKKTATGRTFKQK